MVLPFAVEQFFDVFRLYNEAVWPFQFALLALALVAIHAAVSRRRRAGLVVSLILGFLWAWLALAYHFAFFARINPAAYAFAAASLFGGILFVWHGALKRRLGFAFERGWRAYLGACLLFYALLVYPLWSIAAGHAYPAMPTFGLPCPTTLFTIGILGFLRPPYPRSIFIVPVLWSGIGGSAAFMLDVPPDTGLLVAGLAGLLMAAGRPAAANAAGS